MSGYFCIQGHPKWQSQNICEYYKTIQFLHTESKDGTSNRAQDLIAPVLLPETDDVQETGQWKLALKVISCCRNKA